MTPHPEPVRREARIRKPPRRHLPSPVDPEEEVVVRPPAPAEDGDQLAQMQRLLNLCMDLCKEVAKRDTEWVPELLWQIRAEFERQRREQRKVLQQLITGIELMERIARRTTSEEPAAKRVRPLSVETCSDGDGGSEVRPSALLVAEPSGALGIRAGVPVADLAEARSTPRATESVAASEEVPPMKSPSQPRSVKPSPPAAEVRPAEEAAPVSVVSAAPRLSAVAEELPSEAAVQSAVQQLMAIFAAARQLCRCWPARLRAP